MGKIFVFVAALVLVEHRINSISESLNEVLSPSGHSVLEKTIQTRNHNEDLVSLRAHP